MLMLLPFTFCSMCFVLQWQLHVSRAVMRQDGSSVNMPPLASASDAQLLRNILSGPAPTLLELRANPSATSGECVVQSFKNCDAGQWLVAEADSRNALKVPLSFEEREFEADSLTHVVGSSVLSATMQMLTPLSWAPAPVCCLIFRRCRLNLPWLRRWLWLCDVFTGSRSCARAGKSHRNSSHAGKRSAAHTLSCIP
jgi:hypothetical protein